MLDSNTVYLVFIYNNIYTYDQRPEMHTWMSLKKYFVILLKAALKNQHFTQIPNDDLNVELVLVENR